MRLLTLALVAAATPAFLPAHLPAQMPADSGPTTLHSTPGQAADSTAAPTVSVPLHNGDQLNVTGPLAIRHRGSQQFLVIESPTPYRITSPLGADGPSARPHIIRDIAFTLPRGHNAPGAAQDFSEFVGRTVTASGRVRLQPTPATWNGAVLTSTTVILPGGKELRAGH